jgi:hypothetical protein
LIFPAAEVLGFALPQFAVGRAHRALQRVAAHPTLAHQLRLRQGHLLQPLAGLLVALWLAEQQQQQQELEQPQGQAPQRRQSLLRALDRQAALTDDVLRGLLRAQVSSGTGWHPPCSCAWRVHDSAMRRALPWMPEWVICALPSLSAADWH